jgi:phosphoribosylpyrophosphate synthetase
MTPEVSSTNLGYEEKRRESLTKLYDGLRSRPDPITWRTMVVDARFILGAKEKPEFERPTASYLEAKTLVERLTEETYLQGLRQEILYSLGYREQVLREEREGALDALLLNGRQNPPDELFWALADHLAGQGRKIAAINSVGHYNDGQGRVIAPPLLLKEVKNCVILASTQKMYGGDPDVLEDVIGTLRSPAFTAQIDNVYVGNPMFGGSRGHRPGQADEIGYEVLEVNSESQKLALYTRDVLRQVKKDCRGRVPKVTFLTVDIHNNKLPGGEFRKHGFKFVSVNPARELAQETCRVIKEKNLADLPLKVIACDKGAIPRTEAFVRTILTYGLNHTEFIDVVYVEKDRPRAGEVAKAEIAGVTRFAKDGFKISVRKVKSFPTRVVPFVGPCVVVLTDDMLDTGGTNATDFATIVKPVFPNAELKISVGTHPVLSKGLAPLDTIGADVFVLGNTLSPRGLRDHSKVRIVDLAPAIAREIFK